MEKRRLKCSLRTSTHFIGFNQDDAIFKRSSQQHLRKQWLQQQRFYKNTNLNCDNDIKIVEDAKNNEERYDNHENRSCRTIKYHLKEERRDIFISDYHLRSRLEDYISKEYYFDFNKVEHNYVNEPPERYFNYSHIRCQACHRIGHTSGECTGQRVYPIVNPHRRCIFCERKGHSIDECELYNQPLVERDGVLWRGGKRQGLINECDLNNTACGIDY